MLIYANTALIFAADNGHLEIVEYLLEKGANIEAGNIDKSRSLFFLIILLPWYLHH